MKLLAVVLVSAVALVGMSSGAAAHSGHSLDGGPWLSVVNSVDADGVAAVVAGDRTMNLAIEDGVNVEVPGYLNEPYLRISSFGSWQVNVTSFSFLLNSNPDTILEEDFTKLVTTAQERADEADELVNWQPASNGRLIAFYDHRLYWNNILDGDLLASTEPSRQAVWEVPVVVDGVPGAINGELWFDVTLVAPPAARYMLGSDTKPSSSGVPFWMLGAVLAAGALAGWALAQGLRVRRTSEPAETELP